MAAGLRGRSGGPTESLWSSGLHGLSDPVPALRAGVSHSGLARSRRNDRSAGIGASIPILGTHADCCSLGLRERLHTLGRFIHPRPVDTIGAIR